jgi:hypothetical protein
MKISKWGIAFIIFCVASCTAYLFHDHQNPCQDKERKKECEEWKSKHPREYKNYLKRNPKKDTL